MSYFHDNVNHTQWPWVSINSHHFHLLVSTQGEKVPPMGLNRHEACLMEQEIFAVQTLTFKFSAANSSKK